MTEDVFQMASRFGAAEVHFCSDLDIGLRAIVAIHSTRLGPALGGCRFLAYPDSAAALEDAVRLSRAMSYKAALSGLPLGGGKAVIIRPRGQVERGRLFRRFGAFVESLGGRYITAVDSGSCATDMDHIAERTRYVTCLSPARGGHGDPSPYTALGVLHAMQAALLRRGHRTLNGIHVAIQGVGHVGSELARLLYARGARLTISDIDTEAVARLRGELDAEAVAPEEIVSTSCDVLAPCALGGVLDRQRIASLQAAVICGGANNQLASPEDGRRLHERNVLYVPDYVANAGGIIQIMSARWGEDEDTLASRLAGIGETVGKVLDYAAETGFSCAEAADRLAALRLREA